MNAQNAPAQSAASSPREAPVFIADDRTVLTGEAARRALATRSDAPRVRPGSGITRVEPERWQEAQRYERRTWMNDFRNVADDRNQFHATQFQGYESLKGKEFSAAIELGCGPFTNMRLIAPVTNIGEIHLLDPLINDYVTHPNCTYSEGALRTPTLPARPVTLHASAIENFLAPKSFDLVVMVNVIEHCMDAERIFSNLLSMLQVGGTLVFHDRSYDAADLAENLRHEYDAGHPLRVDRAVIDRFLTDNFTPVLSRVVRFERTKWGADRSYDGVYFIGTRTK